MNEHIHKKADVEWEKNPELGGNWDSAIPWYGTCRLCGKRVYEVYLQQEELYEQEVHE